MGIGSPRLRRRLRACALPLFAAAGLIGAPAAYAGGVGPVDASVPVAPAPTASLAPASAVTDPVAATIVAPSSVINVVDNAARPAVSTVGHAADTAMRAVANTRTQAQATVRQLAQLHPAPQSPPAAPPPLTSRSKEIPGVFRHAHTTHVSAAPRRGVQSLPGSWTPGWRSAVSGSRSTGTPTGSRPALPRLAPFSAADWPSGLNSGGSASSASSAGGVLLLAILVFALTCVPADAGRRVLLLVRALRPTPPLLRLERPD